MAQGHDMTLTMVERSYRGVAKIFLIRPMNQIDQFELASKPIFCQDDFGSQVLFYIICVLITILVIKRFD
jgi:hypothetical protein